MILLSHFKSIFKRFTRFNGKKDYIVKINFTKKNYQESNNDKFKSIYKI